MGKTESRSDDESTRTRAEALRSSSQPKKTGVFHGFFLDDDAAARQTLNLGSSQSRKLSPNRLKAKTATEMARPGNRIIHGASR